MKCLFVSIIIIMIQSTQPRVTVAVVIYTKGGDAYDCILLIWKSKNEKTEGGKKT